MLFYTHTTSMLPKTSVYHTFLFIIPIEKQCFKMHYIKPISKNHWYMVIILTESSQISIFPCAMFTRYKMTEVYIIMLDYKHCVYGT